MLKELIRSASSRTKESEAPMLSAEALERVVTSRGGVLGEHMGYVNQEPAHMSLWVFLVEKLSQDLLFHWGRAASEHLVSELFYSSPREVLGAAHRSLLLGLPLREGEVERAWQNWDLDHPVYDMTDRVAYLKLNSERYRSWLWLLEQLQADLLSLWARPLLEKVTAELYFSGGDYMWQSTEEKLRYLRKEAGLSLD